MKEFIDQAKDFVSNYKWYVIAAGAAVVAALVLMG